MLARPRPPPHPRAPRPLRDRARNLALPRLLPRRPPRQHPQPLLRLRQPLPPLLPRRRRHRSPTVSLLRRLMPRPHRIPPLPPSRAPRMRARRRERDLRPARRRRLPLRPPALRVLRAPVPAAHPVRATTPSLHHRAWAPAAVTPIAAPTAARIVRRVRVTTRSHRRRACPVPVVVTMPSSVPPQARVDPAPRPALADPGRARRVRVLPVPVEPRARVPVRA